MYNTLFGQTLALKLNMLYDENLSGFLFTSPHFFAAENLSGCGTEPKAAFIDGYLAQSVYDYLVCASYGTTVGSLFTLANDALGMPALPHVLV